MNYERTSFFDRSDFPSTWEKEDFNALAEFCREEFNAAFVEVLDDPEHYDYYLFVETEAEQ